MLKKIILNIVIVHKYWLCQHASKNKTNKNGVISKRNTVCQALINILKKKNNKDTRKNDSFLKKDPPLCALVQLKLNHNHPINSCGEVRHLRVSDETRNTFLAYFDDGLTASEALHTHESKLMLLNPTKRQVYYIHYEWRKDNYGPIHEPLP
ncbi:C2H2-type domain-containing protein, partial [Aphis craccivora]